ncbi:MAG: hypothetical protein KGK02_06295 [Rhodospirillales bacterium]|nr:hypothetical protein [Rhodospirillales bacterium]
MARYSRFARAITSGSCARSQASMANVQVGFTRLSEAAIISFPAFLCSSAASAAARWSLHIIAGRSTAPAPSVSTGICAPAEMPIQATSPGPIPATTWRTARQSAAYHSAGSCSAQPKCRICVETGALASAFTRPSVVINVAFRLPAPRSIPSRYVSGKANAPGVRDGGSLTSRPCQIP